MQTLNFKNERYIHSNDSYLAASGYVDGYLHTFIINKLGGSYRLIHNNYTEDFITCEPAYYSSNCIFELMDKAEEIINSYSATTVCEEDHNLVSEDELEELIQQYQPVKLQLGKIPNGQFILADFLERLPVNNGSPFYLPTIKLALSYYSLALSSFITHGEVQ